MKKNLLLLVLALIGMGGFTACSNEDDLLVQEQTNTKPVVIRATIGNVSRLALGDSEGGQTKLSWGTGDAFALTIGGNSYTFNWVSGNDFKCDDFPTTFAETTTITATYPATAASGLSVQSGTNAKVGNYMQMTASKEVTAGQPTTDLNLSFEHQTSVVEIALEKSELASKSVVVDLRTIAESMYSTPADGEGVLSFGNDGKLKVYFAVSPTGEVVEDWYVGVKDINGNEYYTATLSNLQLAASKMYKVSKTGEALKNTSYLVSADEKTVIAYDAEGLEKWAEMAKADLNNTIVNLELGADITLSTEGITLTDELPDKGNWTPLGYTNYEYKGTIDGKNHTIKNMYIVDNTDNAWRIGFLGASNATIKNLKFDNAKIVFEKGTGFIGVISGASSSNIDNCHVTNSIVKYLGSTTTQALGGLVGSMSPHNSGNSTKKITNSSFSGTIVGHNQVGGIAGKLQCWESGYVYITNCSVEGTVTGQYQVGGIVGECGGFNGSGFTPGNVSAVEMCTNEATVTGAASGGVVGCLTSYGYVVGCTNQGEIYGNSYELAGSDKSGTGGIVGLIEYTSSNNAIKKSYVIGCRNLSDKVYLSDEAENIGGVVGYQNNLRSGVYGSYAVESVTNASYTKKAEQAIGNVVTGTYVTNSENYAFASVSDAGLTETVVTAMNTAITSGFGAADDYNYKNDKSAYKNYRWSWTEGSGIWPEFKASVTP